MKIGKIASSAEYRMDKQLQNCQFLQPNFGLPHWKSSRNLLNFQFGQFQKFLMRQVSKIVNLENFRNCHFGKFKKNCNLEASKNLEISQNSHF